MAWKEMSIEELADSLGVDVGEVREKQRLMALIVRIRKERGLSQAKLAQKVGVTQGRIAQIESGVGTSRVTFDVLLGILGALGYDYRIVTKRAA
ncbi:MAG TPA: helix-turn-helix domain-containing protein [Bdellovibrionota bacterium]|nr:helix-turn-helix domain-containing protein [Bdellovibrionota bacterium]